MAALAWFLTGACPDKSRLLHRAWTSSTTEMVRTIAGPQNRVEWCECIQVEKWFLSGFDFGCYSQKYMVHELKMCVTLLRWVSSDQSWHLSSEGQPTRRRQKAVRRRTRRHGQNAKTYVLVSGHFISERRTYSGVVGFPGQNTNHPIPF